MNQKTLDKLLPLTDYNRSVTWTSQGSVDGLIAKVHDEFKDVPTVKPAEVIVYLKRLADGGYQIHTYKSRE